MRAGTEAAWPVLTTHIRGQLSEDIKNEIRRLQTIRPWRSVALYLRAYAVIAGAIAVASYVVHPLVTLLAIIVIAGRQHALYILNHDASHHILFTSRFANKLAGTVLSNLVMFHHPEAWSYVQWQRVHLLHHMHLFTPNDPNYVGRQLKKETERHYSPAVLVWLCIKSGLLSITQLFVGRQDYVAVKSREAVKGRDHHVRALLLPFRDDAEMETERRIKLVVFAVALALIGYFHLWGPFLLFWIVPMYTVYPMILTLMDLTEHRWTEGAEDLNQNTRATRIGFLTRFFFIPLPRTFHREHHAFSGVPVVALPRINQLLQQARFTPPPTPGFAGLFRELSVATARQRVTDHAAAR